MPGPSANDQVVTPKKVFDRISPFPKIEQKWLHQTPMHDRSHPGQEPLHAEAGLTAWFGVGVTSDQPDKEAAAPLLAQAHSTGEPQSPQLCPLGSGSGKAWVGATAPFWLPEDPSPSLFLGLPPCIQVAMRTGGVQHSHIPPKASRASPPVCLHVLAWVGGTAG